MHIRAVAWSVQLPAPPASSRSPPTDAAAVMQNLITTRYPRPARPGRPARRREAGIKTSNGVTRWSLITLSSRSECLCSAPGPRARVTPRPSNEEQKLIKG
ncbi:hypothetical protein EVAR_31769_1 [Eumeta japonica]|uniref:Uncharacterized protein n=1 Tax=Eumeta variegata TaxID=151549 RepID=A0A4C1W6S1_EUMVA|nr:hypothetical protein EVAR_31769_1 [Eumeta japonica]